MLFQRVKILFIGMAVLALLSGAGFMAKNSTTPESDELIPIASLKLITTTEQRMVAGVPIPSRKPQKKSPSVFQRLASFTVHKNEESKSPEPVSKRAQQLSQNIMDQDSFLYAEIFDLQKQGKMSQADEKINQLGNNTLRGHILAERYLHPTGYKTDYTELAAWMRDYADHPQAKRIHRLASIRKPKGSGQLVAPETQSKIAGNLGAVSKRGKSYKSSKKLSSAQDRKVRSFKRDIRKQLKRNQPTLAMNILNTDYTVKHIDDVEYDRLRAEIAAVYLFNNKLSQALSLAKKSVQRSGKKAPLAGWVKGLAQWQRGQYGSSSNGFELAASSPYSSGWMVSAAAYWASRANMRNGHKREVNKWLDLASTYPRTF